MFASEPVYELGVTALYWDLGKPYDSVEVSKLKKATDRSESYLALSKTKMDEYEYESGAVDKYI